MMQPQQAIVSLGSNVADGETRLQKALEWLASVMTDISDSGIYTSEAVNGTGCYYNMVVKGKTILGVDEFEAQAKAMEKQQGRVRPSQQVALDIDLVQLGSTVVRPAELCRLYFLQGFRLLP